MRKYLLIIIISFILFPQIVLANDIRSIKMDIYIDSDGTAHVTETWLAKLSSGSEGYKPYYNLGNATISDYSVSFNNKIFTTLTTWDTSKTFVEKSYKAGINEIYDGLELCFGISSYGTNEYILKYKINGFVTRLNDADMVYWTLIPHNLSDKPEEAYIRIHSDFQYEDTLEVWGYGNYGGFAYVYDGQIDMLNEDGLSSNEHMTILVKFPKDTFNTNNILNDNFETYLNMADEGAVKYDDSGHGSYNSKKDSIYSFIVSITYMSFFVGVIVSLFKYINVNPYGTKKLIFPKEVKKTDKSIPYFRDIPLDKNIFKAYWIAGNFNLVKRKTDFLGAILLKWLMEKRISNSTEKNKKSITFINKDNLEGFELNLYTMMYEASKDGNLSEREFISWCRAHYSRIIGWFDTVIDSVTDTFVTENKIIIKPKKLLFLNMDKYHVTPLIKDDATKMKGLKNFLKDFSMIKDRGAIEVNLWEYYLIYAQIFGIAKKVAQEFKNLYPDIITEEYYDNIIFMHHIAGSGVSAASSAKSRAESYSSGGGGFSSGGGGGGSFGGGGGGGGGFR